MRTLLWAAVICLLLVTLILRVGLFYAEEIILDLLRASSREGITLPYCTQLSLSYRKILPLFSIPWILWATFLSVGNRLTGPCVAQVAATALLAAVCITGFAIISTLLPFPDLFYIEAGFKNIDW